MGSLENTVKTSAKVLAITRLITTSLFLIATSAVILYKLLQQKTGFRTWMLIIMLWIAYAFFLEREVLYLNA